MITEADELTLSIGAAYLLYDLATGCSATRSGTGAPCLVMPPLDAPILKTRGRISDLALEELVRHGLVDLVGENFPQPCKLTPLGETHYKRHIKNQWAQSNTAERSTHGKPFIVSRSALVH